MIRKIRVYIYFAAIMLSLTSCKIVDQDSSGSSVKTNHSAISSCSEEISGPSSSDNITDINNGDGFTTDKHTKNGGGSNTSKSSSPHNSSKDTTTRQTYSEDGELFLSTPFNNSLIISSKPTFTWSCEFKAESFIFYLERRNGTTFSQIEKKQGITSSSYTLGYNLEPNSVYRWRVEAITSKGIKKHYGNKKEGVIFMTVADPKTHPANIGRDFNFNGSVSEKVLRNYLSRSMTLSFISNKPTYLDDEFRMILNTGAKYISRAIIPWQAETNYTSTINSYKSLIDILHSFDPDIVVEACIFETVHTSCENVAIPDWVFKAFNQSVEKRNFSYNAMLFPSGLYKNHWGNGFSVPDITRLETRMYFYYRACRYIDAGFEGIHWGQVMLMGKNDTGYACWQELINKVRQYAKTHSRRKFIFNNAHTHGIKGPDGILLFDFHSFPMRNRTPAGSQAHEPTESNPQITELAKGYMDSIYGKSLGGMTASGWSCNSLPYFVEIDNYGGFEANKQYLNKPGRQMWPWGMDEISWFVNQPASYRAEWLDYAYKWVRNNDSAGYLCVAGSRPYYSLSSDQMTWYHIAGNSFGAAISSDEAAIRSIWVNDNK